MPQQEPTEQAPEFTQDAYDKFTEQAGSLQDRYAKANKPQQPMVQEVKVEEELSPQEKFRRAAQRHQLNRDLKSHHAIDFGYLDEFEDKVQAAKKAEKE